MKSMNPNRTLSRRRFFQASVLGASALALPALSRNQAAAAPRNTGPFPPYDPFLPGPLAWSVLAAPIKPVLGTDGLVHLIYEVQIQNASRRYTRIPNFEILDAQEQPITAGNQILSADGVDVTGKVRPFALPAATQSTSDFMDALGPGQGGVIYVNLIFPTLREVPRVLKHRIVSEATLPDQPNIPAVPFTEVDAGTAVLNSPAVVIGAPLRGNNWLVSNGSGAIISPHRYTIQPTNGTLRPPEHFAMDIIQLDAQGKLFNGDPGDVKNWPYYGSDILAVARGTVVEIRNDMPNQVPLQNVPPTKGDDFAGNHVVLSHGRGVFSLYAHLVPGSVVVKPGDVVRPGQVLGQLGNSGNSDGPHLHFHIMDSSSPLNTNGLPFVFSQINYQGRINGSLNDVGSTLFSGNGATIDTTGAGRRTRQMPLTSDVIAFE